ncbi:MAG: methyltransferase domain-containing protein [Deltaproteobacteria bacterium]|nr:MAG: methyltransferase domain-containing protein [Deltaproteobacteria bacterium]
MKCRVNPSYMEQLYSFYSPFYDWVFGKLLEPGRRRAFHYLDRRPHQRILEIGIGPGSTLEKYPPYTNLVGIDISSAMIEEAQKKAAQLNGGSTFDFQVMDAANLEFPDNHFDAVISAYVITTVQDPRKVCREILRVVKPGGQIMVINHTRSPNGGLLGKIEDIVAPVCVRIGFTTDLDVIRVMREVGMNVNRAVKCNLMNTGRIIMATKES